MATRGPGARDLMLILAARDQASPVVDKVTASVKRLGTVSDHTSLKMFGVSMITQRVGQAMTRTGAATLALGGLTAKMAADFDYGMRLVRTQSDSTEKQFKKLTDAAGSLASKVPQAAEEITEGLYDIFSSIDVSHKQAIKMVGLFSKAATAGASDIRTVSRSAISMLNAFSLSAEDTTKVLDIQFQLVKEGVGTYDEIVQSMADILPPSKAAGQQLEEMAGVFAASTRWLGNTAKAGISVARAMDLITRPDNVDNMKKFLGVEVINKATGEYRNMSDIIGDMGVAMEGLTGPERTRALEAVFGIGEIRAMRFFKVAIPNFKDLNLWTDRFYGPEKQGAMLRAYDIMAQAPLVQFRILINNLKQGAREMGESFIPGLLSLGTLVRKAADWFRGLSDGTKSAIGQFIIFGGATLLLSGLILRLISGITGVISLMGLAGLSMATVTGMIGGVVGGSMLLIGTLAKLAGESGSTVDSFGDFALKAGAVTLALMAVFTAVAKIVPVIGSVAAAMRNWGQLMATIVMNPLQTLPMMLQSLNYAAVAATAVIAILAIGFWQASQRAAAFRAEAQTLSQKLISGAVSAEMAKDRIWELIKAEYGLENASRRVLAVWGMGIKFNEIWTETLDLSRQALQEQLNQLHANGIHLSRYTFELYEAAIAAGNFAKAQDILNKAQELDAAKAVKKQTERLREQYDGFADMNKIMEETTDQTKELSGAQQEQADVAQDQVNQLDQLSDTLEELSKSGGHLSKMMNGMVAAELAAEDYAGALEVANIALANHQAALQETTKAFSAFETKVAKTAAEVIGMSEDQVKAILNYNSNWQKAVGMGLPIKFLDQLKKMGLEGAQALHELTHAAEVSFEQFQVAADTVIGMSDDQIDAILNYAKNWQKLTTMGLPAEFLAQLQELGLGGAGAVAELANATAAEAGKIIQAWQALGAEAQTKFQQAQHEAQQAHQTDINNTVAAWQALADEAANSGESILETNKELLKAIKEYAKDWDRLLKRGLPKALAAQLKEMGLEGANVVAALAEANKSEFNRIVRTWQQSQAALEGVFNTVDTFSLKIKQIPDKKVDIQLEIDQAKAELEKFIDKINNLEVGIEVNASGVTSPGGGTGKNAQTRAKGKGKGKKSHEGGYVWGHGDVPAILKAGEYVFSDKAVSTLGVEYLENLHSSAKGYKYHEGGVVTGAMPHGHVELMFDKVSKAVQELADNVQNFQLSNVTGSGLNANAQYALRATTGTFPWTFLLSGKRESDTVPGPSVSQHVFGNAIDISTNKAYSELWAVFDWAYQNRDKLKLNYTVLGADPSPYGIGKSFSHGSGMGDASAGQDADHWNHVHMDFWPPIGSYGKGGIAMSKMLGMFGDVGREAIIPLQTAGGQRALSDAMVAAMQRSSTSTPRSLGANEASTKEVHIHFHGASPDAKQVAAEIDWNRRTTGW